MFRQAMKAQMQLHGILNLLKPPGMTSHDVVDCVRQRLGVQRVGHTGVLDPAASGVLVLCVGDATRLSEAVASLPKTYCAEITLGITTSTYDAEGEVIARRSAGHVTQAAVLSHLPAFTGELQQIPPPLAAVHFQGKKLYQWNREGLRVMPAARAVRVDSLRLIRFTEGEFPRIIVEAVCSKGTYIRSLAHDFGQAVGCGAYLSFLVRKSVGGQWPIEDSLTLETLANSSDPRSLLFPMTAAVQHMPCMNLKTRGVARARNGMVLEPQDFTGPQTYPYETQVALLDTRGHLVALGEFRQTARQYFQVKPRKVFAEYANPEEL